MLKRSTLMTIASIVLAWPVSALAQPMEKVSVVSAWTGLWDTSQPLFCAQRGEFAKAGLDVDVIFAPGNATMAVIAGGKDIGYSPGTNGVLAAYEKGGKIKIISSEFLGQNDTFWYVRADSSIKGIDDIKGKTVAFTRPGSAAEAILQVLKSERRLDFKSVSTGQMDATFTMVMTKQIDVGFSVPPSGMTAVEKGDIRVVFSGDDADALKNVTGRVVMASADFIKNRRPTAIKFMEILDKCIDWAYANKAEAAKMYAALNKIDEKTAQKSLEFYKRETLAFGPVQGLDQLMKQAVDGKFLERPLTPDEIKDLFDTIYVSPK